MVRKTAIALAASAALAGAALAPTSALAWHPHHHGYHGGHGWVGPAIVAGALLGTAAIAAEQSCYRVVWVQTKYGPRRARVNICE